MGRSFIDNEASPSALLCEVLWAQHHQAPEQEAAIHRGRIYSALSLQLEEKLQPLSALIFWGESDRKRRSLFGKQLKEDSSVEMW